MSTRPGRRGGAGKGGDERDVDTFTGVLVGHIPQRSCLRTSSHTHHDCMETEERRARRLECGLDWNAHLHDGSPWGVVDIPKTSKQNTIACNTTSPALVRFMNRPFSTAAPRGQCTDGWHSILDAAPGLLEHARLCNRAGGFQKSPDVEDVVTVAATGSRSSWARPRIFAGGHPLASPQSA